MNNTDGVIVIGTEIDTKGFDKEIAILEDKLNDIRATLQMADEDKTLFSTREVKEMEAEAQKLGRRIDSLKQKQQKLDSIGFVNTQNSLKKVVKNITKWGLAIFGIRSAYSMIRQAVSQVVAEDEQLKNQLDYMKWVLAQFIKPIVEFVVQLVYKILVAIGGIVKKLFGINIYSKTTAENFKNANKNAKELKKTLAGFDEMNILNADGSTGLLGSFGDLAEDVDKFSESWFRMPTKEEWKQVFNRMVQPFTYIIDYLKQNVWDPFIENLKLTIEELKPIWEPLVVTFKEFIDNKIKPKWEELKTFMSDKIELLKPIWQPIYDTFIEFINGIIWVINNTFGQFGIKLDYIETKSKITGDKIKDDINSALISIQQEAETTKNYITGIWENLKKLTSTTWDVTFGAIFNKNKGNTTGMAKGGIVYHNLPKLALGGVVNMPSRGVPVGGAIAGERGAEGVIPLTDSQQMALLGEAIGRYITVNLTNVNTMNGRVLSKEIKRVENESNFAYNR